MNMPHLTHRYPVFDQGVQATVDRVDAHGSALTFDTMQHHAQAIYDQCQPGGTELVTCDRCHKVLQVGEWPFCRGRHGDASIRRGGDYEPVPFSSPTDNCLEHTGRHC